MKLTRSEAGSPLWVKLEEHIKSRLADKRAENDNDKDAIATARLRGCISELKEFLLLAQQAPEPETDEPE